MNVIEGIQNIPQKEYDVVIIGSGLYGAVLAREMMDAGKSVLVVDKRNHIAGNVYTKEQEGINVHKYGAHIFHTNDERVWDYANRFAKFNRYTNQPIARYKDELYSMPFNMYTFNAMWGVKTPQEAQAILEEQRKEVQGIPQNLEEQAISLVGRDVYEKLVKGYTEKQWGKPCDQLPSFIIKRLPVRLTFDNNYFNAAYQGIPKGGYTKMVENMLEGADVLLETDFLENRDLLKKKGKLLVYTGPVDAYFDNCYGPLEYRSLRFEEETMDTDNYQGNAVVNYTEAEIPYTRIIEHKWFENTPSEKTVITREYPADWKPGMEPYYPMNDEKNNALFARYQKLAEKEEGVLFGGRLGQYKYFDMDQVIASALAAAKKVLQEQTSVNSAETKLEEGKEDQSRA